MRVPALALVALGALLFPAAAAWMDGPREARDEAPAPWWVRGEDAGGAFVEGYALSDDGVHLAYWLKGIAGGTVGWSDLAGLTSDADLPGLRVVAEPSRGEALTAYTLTFRDASGAVRGVLDLREAGPGARLGPMAAGERWSMAATVGLADGATAAGLPGPVTLRVLRDPAR